jgi:peptide chain release factor subunit 1
VPTGLALSARKIWEKNSKSSWPRDRPTGNVRRELGTAGHIKTPRTARLVRAALESARERLRSVSSVPDGGLALFCGSVGGHRVIELVTGRRPIERKGYLCAHEFDLEVISASLRTADGPRVGLVVVDGGGAVGASLRGDEVDRVFERRMGRWTSGSRRGGQSALRFARLRDEQEHNYLTLVSEQVEAAFTADGLPTVQALVLAGPGDKKDELRERLPAGLQAIVRSVVTTARGGEDGLREALEAALATVDATDVAREAADVQAVLQALELNDDLVTYTPAAVLAAAADGYVDRVVVAGDAPCLPELREHCRRNGSRLDLVTGRSEAGARLVREFGGAAALLRYPVGWE